MDQTTPSLEKIEEQPTPIDPSSIPWPPPRSGTMLAGGGAVAGLAAAGEPGGGAAACRPGGGGQSWRARAKGRGEG